MVAAAIGATVVGGVASSAISAGASSDAADAQSQAASSNLALATTQYDNQQQQIAPYLASGQTGLAGYADLSGANGAAAQNAQIGDIKTGAQYQGDMQTANENILANASATGGLRGSNTSNTLGNTSISTLNSLITSKLAGYGTLMSNGINAINGQQAANNAFTTAATSANNQTANAATSYAGSLANSANSALGSITSGINRYAVANPSTGTSGFNPTYQAAYSGIDNPDNYG